MTPDRAALLSRVDAFDIDGGPDSALPFAARLARDHGWNRHYADRVVREYKRFAFLAAAGFGPVCPSEDVDAAWHLHLTYTRSYWTRFCGDVLGTPLHHEPTKGGPAEGRKHLTMYAHTLAAYREAFGEPPPADVWPAAAERFGIDLRHRVVNIARNWVVPKRPVVRAVQLLAALVVVAVFIPGCDGGFNPFDLVGKDFLAFFIPALVGAVAAGRLIRSGLRSPGPHPGDEDQTLTWEQAAHLAGGAPRLTAATVVRLTAAGAILKGESVLNRASGVSSRRFGPVEETVLNHLPVNRGDLNAVQLAVQAKYAVEAARLEAEGYTLPNGRRRLAVYAAFLPVLLVVLGFGVPRLMTGLGAANPVGYLLTAMSIGLMVGLVAAFWRVPRLTRRGEAALRRTRDRNSALKEKSAPGADVGLAVALFGTIVLTGTAYEYLGAWYPRQTHSGSSGGCGSGCGTSGGGGCGAADGGDGGGDGGGGGGCGGGGCGGVGGGD